MSPSPWTKDRPLTEPTVRTLLRTQFPALAAEEIRPFAEGWDSEGWLGPRFVDLVLDAYGGPVDAGFRDRIRIRGRQVALLEFGAALDPTSNQSVEATRIWIRNAFGAE